MWCSAAQLPCPTTRTPPTHTESPSMCRTRRIIFLRCGHVSRPPAASPSAFYPLPSGMLLEFWERVLSQNCGSSGKVVFLVKVCLSWGSILSQNSDVFRESRLLGKPCLSWESILSQNSSSFWNAVFWASPAFPGKGCSPRKFSSFWKAVF